MLFSLRKSTKYAIRLGVQTFAYDCILVIQTQSVRFLETTFSSEYADHKVYLNTRALQSAELPPSTEDDIHMHKHSPRHPPDRKSGV